MADDVSITSLEFKVPLDKLMEILQDCLDLGVDLVEFDCKNVWVDEVTQNLCILLN